MHKVKVAVLRGGPSSEYDVSLKTGQSILKSLGEHYDVTDVLIDKQGVWHTRGLAKTPNDVLKHVDVAINAMHGKYGEDGTVQRILETFNMPYTGSDSLGSALGMNKHAAKQVFKSKGIKTPYYETLQKLADIPGSIEEQAAKIFKSFPLPAVIKPVSSGSSIGVSIVRNLEELEEGLRKAYEFGDQIIIEEFIQGKEATCGVINDFRNSEVYPLLPIEIRPKSSHFFDYNSKYNEGGAEEICPGNFTDFEKYAIQSAAIEAHKALNLRHYSRSDFIVHPRRGVYLLEVNTLPGLTPESLFPKSLKAIGSSISEFLDHIVKLALRR